MVIRTQKDKKLQTLIEVCTDFASLSHTANVHRPAEQVFVLEKDDDREEEMFAVVDRQQGTHGGRWNHLCLRIYSRCSPSHVAWAMRCDRLLAVLTPLDKHRVPSRLRIRNIAHHSDLATIPGPNASAVVS